MSEDRIESEDLALPEPDDLAEGAEHEEAPKLTLKQKLMTAGAVIVCFVIFSIVFMPYETIVRSVVRSTAKVARIQFRTLDLNLFSADVITDLRVTTPDGSFARATVLRSSVSYLSLLSEHASGSIRIPRLEIEAAGLEATADAVHLELNLRNLFQPAPRWVGFVALRTGPLKIAALPPAITALASDLDPATVKIASVQLQAKLESGGRMLLDGTSIKSNLLNVRVKGAGRVRDSIVNPDLDAEICLRAAPQLETTNKTLFDTYIALGGTAAGEMCPKVRGVPGSLKWELPQKQPSLAQ